MSIVGGMTLGRYRILAELSSGGMGEVYRAQHEVLGKSVAIKVLRPELTSDPQQVTRFLNEAKAASAIQHPGIIRIDDFGTTDDGVSFLVMEFLEGQTLGARIRARGKLDEKEARAITRGIAGALQAAHDKGIFHRDLKPDNIFLVRDPDTGERPKVLDFGIAKLTDSTGRTQTGALLGTPLYMAPEQARAAASIDHRADLYSLGCILYELVVGEPPFLGAGAGELIAMQMFEDPMPPRERVPTISVDLERIILRLLQKEPADRYQSASDLVSALSGPVPASPAAAVETAPPRQRPSVMPLVAGAITIAIAGIVAFAVTRKGHDPKPPPPPPPAVQQTATPAPTPPVVLPPPVVEEAVVVKPAVKTPRKKPAQQTVTQPPPDDQHSKGGSPIELTP